MRARLFRRRPSAATSTRQPTTSTRSSASSITKRRQLGDLPAQPLWPQDAQLLRQGAQPGSRPTRDNLLGTDDRGRDLLAQLIYGFRVSVLFGAGAHGHRRRCSGVIDRRDPGLLRRQDRPGLPALHRDLGLDARAVPADHLQRDLRAQRGAAADPAEPVRLDGAVATTCAPNSCATGRWTMCGRRGRWAWATAGSCGATSCPTA